MFNELEEIQIEKCCRRQIERVINTQMVQFCGLSAMLIIILFALYGMLDSHFTNLNARLDRLEAAQVIRLDKTVPSSSSSTTPEASR